MATKTGNGNVAHGRVTQVLGGVVDCEFPPDQLPQLYDAIEVRREGQEPLVLEVQRSMGHNWVRCVAMDGTDGLRRGAEALGTGASISVPVGQGTLGRIFNVLGHTIDNMGPVDTDLRSPIHRLAPPFEDQVTTVQVFETGLKVIDLIAP